MNGINNVLTFFNTFGIVHYLENAYLYIVIKNKDTMKAIITKKVLGVNSTIVNDISRCDVENEYIKSIKNKMPFYIIENNRPVLYGTFAICNLLGIEDCSLLIKKLNN
jgi:hypothetical protein